MSLDRVNQLERLESYNNEPLEVTQLNYISFVLNGVYYYYQLPDNPFFDFIYQKTPVVNGNYTSNYANIDKKREWAADCFLKMGCSNADITEAAHLIFNMLLTAPLCKRLPGKQNLRKIDF